MLQPVESIPSRHGADVVTGRKLAARLRWVTRNPDPDPARWTALGRGHLVGDPLADAVAAWLGDTGARGWVTFERALTHLPPAGGQLADDLPEPVAALLRTALTPPRWIDPVLEQRGARFFARSGSAAYYVLRDVALMGGFQAAGFNRTLILTGALEQGAARRVADTMRWVIDVTAENGLEPGAAGFASTLRVRLMHALVRRRVLADPRWERAALGVPVSQTDMVATWLGFSVLFLLGVRGMGVPVSRDDARAVMALWRRACWLMGVDDAWLTGDEAEGRRLLYQTIVAQLPPDESSEQLGRALMEESDGHAYPWPQAVWAAVERRKHLSVTRLFLGGRAMEALGLPTDALPWFPLVQWPANRAANAAARLSTRVEAWLRARGRAAQEKATAAAVAGAARRARATGYDAHALLAEWLGR